MRDPMKERPADELQNMKCIIDGRLPTSSGLVGRYTPTGIWAVRRKHWKAKVHRVDRAVAGWNAVGVICIGVEAPCGVFIDDAAVTMEAPETTLCDECLLADFPRFAVYKLYGQDDRLLYVGYSSGLVNRLKSHHDNTAWWHEVVNYSYQLYTDELTARGVEVEAITHEQPAYNRTGRPCICRGHPTAKAA